MIFHDCPNFTAMLAKKRDDFPQAIVAGWMSPKGELIGAAATACEKHPSGGEMAVAWGACLCAAIKKLDELLADADPTDRERLWSMVRLSLDGLKVVARLKNDLAVGLTPAAAVG